MNNARQFNVTVAIAIAAVGMVSLLVCLFVWSVVQTTPNDNNNNNSKAARLPAELEVINLVKNMAVGNRGYVTPWTMVVTEDKRCFLLGKHTVSAEPDEMARMLIERKEDGYHVYASQVGDEYWLPDHWGVYDPNLIPVTKVY